jgi:hypothetical protein
MAVAGYWRNWERRTAWLMREIVFANIIGNPNIKKEDKPHNSRAIYKIHDDRLVEEKQKEKDKDLYHTTPEEMENIKQMLLKGLNGTS